MTEHKCDVCGWEPDFETRAEIARINRDLADIWLDEFGSRLYKIHMNTTKEQESRVIAAYNELHTQRQDCQSVVRGAELRRVFGYE